jgi:hypothetical protein
MEKTCACCKRRFIPHPAVRHQRYCSDPECQKTRKRDWQREKLAKDSDYRQDQAAAQREWRSRNGDYWRVCTLPIHGAKMGVKLGDTFRLI